MSALLGENILQLANRLQQKQQQMMYGDSPSSSSPPPSTSLDSLFPIKEEARDDTPPPCQSQSDSEPSPPLLNQQQTSLISALSAMNSSPQPPAGNSPWMRNAGRKKSHPVWEFFRDLKLENGSSSVLCLHCGWTGEDRSPNNLRTHLKKSHSQDGVFQKFSERLANTPTQPYVKRVRAGGLLHSQQSVQQQLQHTLQQLPGNDVINIDEMMSNFLDSIPKMEEVINITASSFSVPADNEDDGAIGDGNELVNSRSSSSPSTSDPAPLSSPALSINNNAITAVAAGPAPTTTTVPNLAGLNSMMMASNPLLFMSAALANASTPVCSTPCSSASSTSSSPPFSLTDPACVCILMKMAVDLDLTFAYHRRRGEAEITFESNRTAEKSGGRGKIVALADIGKDIRVTERVNGGNTESELWTKTDVPQFHWAIRGKCTKLLK